MFIFITMLLLPVFFFFFNDTATTEIYTLSLHDALPICRSYAGRGGIGRVPQCAVIRRSHYSVWTTQPEREVPIAFCSGGNSKKSGSRSSADDFPLQSPEDEELVFDDRAAKAPAEVIVAQGRPGHAARVVDK